MRFYITILLLFLSKNCLADSWSEADFYRESVYLAGLTIDCLQTTTFSKNNWGNNYERNPIFGNKHPSTNRIALVCGITGISHFYIAKNLEPAYRTYFQYISIGVEWSVVINNKRSANASISFSIKNM